MENFEKYFDILKIVDENKLNITKLTIFANINGQFEKEKMIQVMNYIYDTWLDIDADFSLARLCDIVCENWEQIQNDEFTDDDIMIELF